MKTSLKLKVYQAIIEKLKSYPGVSKEHLIEAVKFKSSLVEYTHRTFERDLHELIYELGYPIKYDKYKQGYKLDFDNICTQNDKFLNDTFALMQSYATLKKLDDNSKIFDLHLASSDVSNPEFESIVTLLTDGFKAEITYFKIDLDEEITYTISPYFLKEYENKWYLIALDETDGVQKSFAMERIRSVKKIDQKSNISGKLAAKNKLKHTLGVGYFNGKRAFIKIATSEKQAKYFREHRLHASQKEELNTTNVCFFTFELIVNNELLMKFLSYGSSVRVLEPKILVDKINQVASFLGNTATNNTLDFPGEDKMFL